MAWLKLDKDGNFTNPHTGNPIPEPKPFTLLKAIKGHAGEDPPQGIFVCLGEGHYIGIHPTTGTRKSEEVLDARGLAAAGRAVINNGGSWFVEYGEIRF